MVSTDLSAHGYPAFAPDGREVYWSAYAGSFRNQKIYRMAYADTGWTAPDVTDFSGEIADGCPVFSPDGERLYFNSARPTGPGDGGGKGYVWVLEREGSGWTGPEPLGPEVNSGRVSMQVSVAASGAIYFAGWREEGKQDADIYVCEVSGGKLTEAVKLGDEVNSDYQDIAPYIAPDESYILFASMGRPDCEGSADLYVSFRRPRGAWTPARNLGSSINSPDMEAFCGVSPDGKFLFFNSDRGGADRVWWVSTGIIDSLRATEGDLQM
jgi:Tol biopolymer transport system component